MNRPILILDFDGVLCDSTEECIVTAWNAWNLHTHRSQWIRTSLEVPDPFRSMLRAHRNYVRTAGEYLIVIEAARLGRPIDSQADYDELFHNFKSVFARFAERFFYARDRLRTENEIHWLNLHTVYQGMPGALHKLWNAFDVSVVTGKDAKSVKTFFDRFDIDISPSRVFDKDVAHDKLTAIRLIAANACLPLTSTVFVDDNVHHLLPPHDAGCHAFMAGWGYHTSEQIRLAQQRSIPILELQNWTDVLLEEEVKS